MIDVNSPAYERQYAADMRALALEEAVAKSLCDTCYGEGSWDRISRRPEGAGQVNGWKQQARAAIAAVRRYS